MVEGEKYDNQKIQTLPWSASACPSSARSQTRPARDLFVEAFKELRHTVDKGFDPEAVEALYLGNYSSDLFEGHGHMAPIMADAVGLCPVPAMRLEDACASGGVALRRG